MLGGEFVEAQQHIEVVGELGCCLRELGPELGLKSLGRRPCVVEIFGIAYLGEHLLGKWLQ